MTNSPIKIGVMCNPFRSLSAELKLLSGLDVDFLELSVEHNCSRTHLEGQKISFNNPFIAHSGVYLFADPDKNKRTDAIEQYCLDIQLVSKLGFKYFNFHPHNSSEQNCLEFNKIALRTACQLASKHQVEIIVENQKPVNDVDTFNELISTDARAMVLLDVAHAYLAGKEKAVLAFSKTFAKRIRHIHVTDCFDEDDHLFLDEGRFNWREALSVVLKESNPQSITLEAFARIVDEDWLIVDDDNLRLKKTRESLRLLRKFLADTVIKL